MENLSHYNEDPLLSSLSEETKLISLSDTINQPLYQSTASSTLFSNTPTYTSLEPVYFAESSLASNSQYLGHSSSTSANMQTVYCNSNNGGAIYTDLPPVTPLFHPNLYRNPDLNHLVKEESFGSSSPPSSSSQSSSSPPIIQQQGMVLGQTVPSRPSSDCSYRSSSNSPASPVSINYSTAPECGSCGVKYDILWRGSHYLCRQCLSERPTVVTAPCGLPEQPNSSKRKRSTTAARNINQVCTNCDATYSKLWRRSISSGDTVCNACGLYEKLHNVPRPKSMRKDTIQTRKRKPKVPHAPKSKKSPKKTKSKLQEVPVHQQQYIPDSGHNYSLPNYQTLQVRNVYSELHRRHPSPNMNQQSLYNYQRSDIYRHDIYNSVPPNDIISLNMPSPHQHMQFTNS